MFSEWIRSTAFWALDFIRGSKVRKHYDDIKSILENNQGVPREEYLDRILKYATNHVDFYKSYKSYSSLNDFPVINKNFIKEQYEQFQSPEYKNSKVITMSTSGSTGTPFVVRQDLNKRNRVLAEMMYFWGRAGYQIGMKYVFFRIWASENRKSRITAFSRNLVMYDTLDLGEKNFKNIREILKNDKKIKILLGYPSTFDKLANYLIVCGDKPEMFKVESIITISEGLSEAVRKRLKLVFDCPVISHYSNTENGVLAQECLENKEFHVNTASYVVEVLSMESNDPAQPREMGRVVITDLFNKAMPLIRYDTGDLVRLEESSKCSWNTPVFGKIEGRIHDLIYSTNGTPISPHGIGMIMDTHERVVQFQFIQEDAKRYVLKLNGGKEYNSDKEFVDHFKEILGSDAEITVEHVSEIPVLASGKFKETVCNYEPDSDIRDSSSGIFNQGKKEFAR